MTVERFLVDHYAPFVETNRKCGAESVRRIRINFGSFLSRQLSEVDVLSVEKWRSQRLTGGISRLTINRDLVCLRALLSKAVEWDFLVINPLRKLKPYKVDSQGRTRYLSEDEEIRLRIALKDRETEIRTRRDNGNRWRQIRGYGEYPTLASDVYVDHIQPIVLLGMNTGLRRGAIFRLQKSHVDLEKRILTAVGENSKNGKTQYIPLNDEAHAVLSCWLRGQVENDSDYVFPSQNGKPIRDIKHAWGGILRRAKITGVRFHDMRHHFASRLVINGVPLNTVRELLDHSAFKLTLRYAHLSPSATAAAVATLNQPAKEQ